MALLRHADTTKHMELVNWLTVEHGMGLGHANALVAVYLNPTTDLQHARPWGQQHDARRR